MGHVFTVLEIPTQGFLERFIANLFLGGTTLFVFISGYLFNHIFVPRYDFKTFYKGKVYRLLLPFLILGSVPILFRIMTGSQPGGSEYFSTHEILVLGDEVTATLKYLGTGKFALAYWYIPFAMCLYIFAPLHFRFTRLKLPVQLFVVIGFVLLALFLQRPKYYPDSLLVQNLQSVLFFTPVYLFGIMCSIHWEVIRKTLEPRIPILFMLLALFNGIQVYGNGIGTYAKPPLEYNGIDFMLLHKLVMCVLLLILFQRMESRQNKLVTAIANMSFAIYFLHGLLFTFLLYLNSRGTIELGKVANWGSFFLLTAGTLALCMLIAKAFKSVFPAQSRYIIGY